MTLLEATRRPVRAAWSRWPRWSTYGALLWSVSYAVLGAVWWAGVSWYPFAHVADDRTSGSVLEGAPAGVVGPAFVAGGTLGALVAVAMLRPGALPVRVPARWLTAAGATLAVVAAALLPDYTILAIVAMWPVLLVFAFTGLPGAQDGIGDVLYWHRDNLVLIFLGGLLWAAAAVAHARRSRGRCEHCGRRDGTDDPRFTRETLLRWGRWSVWLAVASTVPYDFTRIAWALGWPLGLSSGLYERLQDPPWLLVIGLVLGLLSTAGAGLTHGLVSRWGEVFPRWVWFRAGRPVPPMLAVVPAAIVAVALPPAAFMLIAGFVKDVEGITWVDWGAWFPGIFWLGWAVGLAGATYCYYLRRRGPCRHCMPIEGAMT